MAITNRIILLEGITGAGKSDVAEYITERLIRRGEDAQWFEENDYEHPADYTFHAYMSDDQIKQLSQKDQEQLHAEGTRVLSGIVIPLTKVSVRLLEKILPFKIYDRLDWNTEKTVFLDKWNSFMKTARSGGQIYIFEGSLLQNPVCEALIRFNLEISEISAYIQEVYQIISELCPVIVYLNRTDVRSCAREVSRQRGARWRNKMVDSYTKQAFAKNNGLSGLDGYITCLEQRQRVELKILNSLPVEKHILTDPFDSWEETKQRIDTFLDHLE